MQWSLDQFLEKMLSHKEEGDARVEKIMDKKYDNYLKYEKYAEEKIS